MSDDSIVKDNKGKNKQIISNNIILQSRDISNSEYEVIGSVWTLYNFKEEKYDS